LRPTFGAVSRFGAMPLSWTMDKVGAIARSAVDAGIVFDVMRGADQLDPSARDTSFAWQPGSGPKGLKIGIMTARGWPRSDADKAFVSWLQGLAGKPAEVTLPDAPYGSMLLMLHAEAAAAFDELTRKGLDDGLPGQRGNDWPNQFRVARTIPAVEYIQASRLRHQLVQDMHEAMADIDVLVAPTHGPLLTATNLTGHPTLVLPVGKSTRDRDGGRPTMISLTGQLDGEGALLTVAEAWQEQTEWHRGRPELTNA
jgi:Asp-tRNA(Asn)/Glu-tRNA(Gln) amidotransferase A subunit family amidase